MSVLLQINALPTQLLAEILYKRLSVYSRKYDVPLNTRSISPYLYFRASTVRNYGEKYLSVLQSSTEPASLPRGNAAGTPVASPTLVINSLKHCKKYQNGWCISNLKYTLNNDKQKMHVSSTPDTNIGISGSINDAKLSTDTITLMLMFATTVVHSAAPRVPLFHLTTF